MFGCFRFIWLLNHLFAVSDLGLGVVGLLSVWCSWLGWLVGLDIVLCWWLVRLCCFLRLGCVLSDLFISLIVLLRLLCYLDYVDCFGWSLYLLWIGVMVWLVVCSALLVWVVLKFVGCLNGCFVCVGFVLLFGGVLFVFGGVLWFLFIVCW